jgi:hypothetical protein
MFYPRGGANAAQELQDLFTAFSTTAGTASSQSVLGCGRSRYELENNSGGNASSRVSMIAGLLN